MKAKNEEAIKAQAIEKETYEKNVKAAKAAYDKKAKEAVEKDPEVLKAKASYAAAQMSE